MSNEEYTHRNFWTSSEQISWVQKQEKLVVMQIQKDLDKWFVATSICPTVYKIKNKNDKTI